MGRSMFWKLTALLLLATLRPTLVLAEAPRGIGIVTTLTGQATLTRAAFAQQVLPLKFRDELFYRDRISTKERSMVQVLLRGQALVTARELSELTITEEPGRPSIVNLAIGKLSLAVDRLRMSPGKPIEVHTHNAVVGIRGTVLVVEVTPALTTEVYVLKGSVEVFPSGAPAAVVIVNAFQSVTVMGNVVSPIRSIPPSEVEQIVQDLTPSYQHTEAADDTIQEGAQVLSGETALESGETATITIDPVLSETLQIMSSALIKERTLPATITITTTTTTTTDPSAVVPTTGPVPLSTPTMSTGILPATGPVPLSTSTMSTGILPAMGPVPPSIPTIPTGVLPTTGIASPLGK